ncbi:MAG: hypothetical protein OHK0046_51100 [Anaerolineae bacterium]
MVGRSTLRPYTEDRVCMCVVGDPADVPADDRAGRPHHRLYGWWAQCTAPLLVTDNEN